MKYNLDRLSGMENAISEGFYDLPFDEQVELVDSRRRVCDTVHADDFHRSRSDAIPDTQLA